MNRFIVVFVLLCALALPFAATAQVTSSGLKGWWSGDSTWIGGARPTANDDVVIAIGDTVILDSLAAPGALCKNLTVNGVLRFVRTGAKATITINGDLLVATDTSEFRVQDRSPAGPANSFTEHVITLYGNFTSNGAIDFRRGSNGSGTALGAQLVLTGSTSTTIQMNSSQFNRDRNELNSVILDKSGGSKVTCLTDIYVSNNSSVGTARLTLQNGFIETGNFRWVLFSSSSAVLAGGSDTSYVIGCLGRGIPTGSTGTRFYPVGDSKGYRPVSLVHGINGSTGSHLEVRCIEGNANTGSSAFAGSIDKVSTVRYFKATVDSLPYPMTIIRAIPSYGNDDGVAAGNTNLRIAYSRNDRATWTDMGPNINIDTTDLTTVPQSIGSDTLNSDNTVAPGEAIYYALARVTGTTENSLESGPSSVEKIEGTVPAGYGLEANYPNPFNPTTSITFHVPSQSFVSLMVYDIMGREVATLVSQDMEPGTYLTGWNAQTATSGVYFYTLEAGSFAQTRKMLLVK